MDGVQRRDFLIAAGALLSAPFAADAQQTAKVPRIGYLAGDLAATCKRPSSKDCVTSVTSRAANVVMITMGRAA
jgi:hypothetical protein